jgi:cardiolipin synthase
MEHAFAHIWAMLGDPLPAQEVISRHALAPAGDMSVRVVASVPATAGMFRVDQLVAALARRRLWLTDAYYAGTTAYVQEGYILRRRKGQRGKVERDAVGTEKEEQG